MNIDSEVEEAWGLRPRVSTRTPRLRLQSQHRAAPTACTHGVPPTPVPPANELPWGQVGGMDMQALHLLLGSGSCFNREGVSPFPRPQTDTRETLGACVPPGCVPVEGDTEEREPGVWGR